MPCSKRARAVRSDGVRAEALPSLPDLSNAGAQI